MSDTKKKRQSWNREVGTGIISIVQKDSKGKEINRFTIADATKLFPEYNSFNDRKKDIILYGLQQRICDKLAAESTKTVASYRDVYNNILDGSFYNKKKVTRLTVTKKAEAIKDTLTPDQLVLLKKLGILK